jgi:hypothetical protein
VTMIAVDAHSGLLRILSTNSATCRSPDRMSV